MRPPFFVLQSPNPTQNTFNTYARDSVVADFSLQAKDITEKSLINQILEKEQTRLGFTVRPVDFSESSTEDLTQVV